MKKFILSAFLIFNGSVLLTTSFTFLIPNRANAQYINLLNFAGATNGQQPWGSLISDGTSLYGMTELGGTNNFGTIFKIKPDGTGYVKLLDFDGANGSKPNGSLITDGVFLYGMTKLGGTNGMGTIFKIMPDGSGYVKLLDFVGASNGREPWGSLISDGTFLYGMTASGGTNDMGTIFKIMPDGSGYVKLLDFAGATSGSYPYGSLITDGVYLYGMTNKGGANDMGTIFKIMSDGTGYVKLLDFAGATNGMYPYGDLITDGTFLYGMTGYGGITGFGAFFKIMPDGSGYVKLLDFIGTSNGKYPWGSLISDGTFLYGMTHMGGANNAGTIFKIMPDGTGYVKLLDFSLAVNGCFPYGSLFSDGTFLYGMAYLGGANGLGTIFKYQYATADITENNAETYLHVYPNPTNGIINITCEKEQKNATLEILNMVGQVMMSVKHINISQGESYLLDMSSLKDGTYIIRLNTCLPARQDYQKIIVKN